MNPIFAENLYVVGVRIICWNICVYYKRRCTTPLLLICSINCWNVENFSHSPNCNVSESQMLNNTKNLCLLDTSLHFVFTWIIWMYNLKWLPYYEQHTIVDIMKCNYFSAHKWNRFGEFQLYRKKKLIQN